MSLRQWRRSRHLRTLAFSDELTGLSNRRAIQAQASDLFATARSHGQALALLMLDIDHFKRVNDTFGHEVGDRVLRAVAAICQRELRRGDRMGRIGGEEFLVLLPGALPSAAQTVAEHLRQAVAALGPAELGAQGQVSISIGVANSGPRDRQLAPLLVRANQALYRAKANGRNRVECADCAVASSS